MNHMQLINGLRLKIESALRPLVDSNYHLLEVPHYSNVGDSLIWQGELDFLSGIPHKRKSMHSWDSFAYKGIDKGDVILFQGGGNFGDIWTTNHDFKMSVVRAFPQNKIIFLPQSVWFRNKDRLNQCANELANHPNITICARDARSYALLKEKFTNRILLVPDMAFYMDMTRWVIPPAGNGDIVLIRKDVERKDSEALNQLLEHTNALVSDWPNMEKGGITGFFMDLMNYSRLKNRIVKDIYANWFYRTSIIKTGIDFIARARHVYSTRLHGAILSVLIGRPITIYDNSYGKNRDFFDTWLDGCDFVEFAK